MRDISSDPYGDVDRAAFDSVWQEVQGEQVDYRRVRQLVVGEFNRQTGKTFNSEALSAADQDEVVAWLNQDVRFCQFATSRPQLDQRFFAGIESKVSWLTQRPCTACELDFPISVIPVDFPAFSQQSTTGRFIRAFRRAMLDKYGERFSLTAEEEYCVRLVFVLGTTRRRRLDVDNLAKGVLDGLQGVLYEGDEQVSHLDLLKVRSNNERDHFFMRVAATTLNTLDNVVRHTYQAGMAVERIDLSEYME